MSLEYETVSLGEHLYIKGRIGWKGLKKDEYLENGDYRIINATALEEDGINWNDCGYITKERFDESPEIILKEKDILISKDGTIGKLGYVKELYMPSTVASGVFVVRNLNEEYIDTDFLYYYFKSPFFKWFIKSVTEGSVIPHLYQRDFADMEFNLFDLDVQKKCSTLLNAIEEKININKKINRNLFKLSRYLYKEFYMDKVESYDKKEYVTLDDVTSKFATGLNPRKNFVLGEGDNYYVTIKNMANNSIVLDDKCASITDEALVKINKRSDLQVGDLLFSGIGTIGRVHLIDEKPTNWNISESVFTMRPNELISSEFLFIMLLSQEIQEYAKSLASGSVQKGIRMRDLKAFEFILPTKDDKYRLDSLLNPIIADIKSNEKEIRNLTKLRDTLLPKLMSGEIDVSKINCDMLPTSRKNWDNKFTVPLQNNLIKVIS